MVAERGDRHLRYQVRLEPYNDRANCIVLSRGSVDYADMDISDLRHSYRNVAPSNSASATQEINEIFVMKDRGRRTAACRAFLIIRSHPVAPHVRIVTERRTGIANQASKSRRKIVGNTNPSTFECCAGGLRARTAPPFWPAPGLRSG